MKQQIRNEIQITSNNFFSSLQKPCGFFYEKADLADSGYLEIQSTINSEQFYLTSREFKIPIEVSFREKGGYFVLTIETPEPVVLQILKTIRLVVSETKGFGVTTLNYMGSQRTVPNGTEIVWDGLPYMGSTEPKGSFAFFSFSSACCNCIFAACAAWKVKSVASGRPVVSSLTLISPVSYRFMNSANGSGICPAFLRCRFNL